MKFFYSRNEGGVSDGGSATGLLSALSRSILFWILIIVIVILIVLLVTLPKKMQAFKTKIFGRGKGGGGVGGNLTEAEKNLGDIFRERDELINSENEKIMAAGGYDGPIPDMNKIVGPDLDEESAENAKLLGLKREMYGITPMKKTTFKLASIPESTNFKLWLRKIKNITDEQVGETRLYNEERKCIGLISINKTNLVTKTISPFAEDSTVPINEARLLNFSTKSNRLLLDQMEIGKFNIVDYIRYIQIECPNVKEINYKRVQLK